MVVSLILLIKELVDGGTAFGFEMDFVDSAFRHSHYLDDFLIG